MQCPDCKSEHIRKNGKNKQDKQNYICVSCSRQFILDYEPLWEEIKKWNCYF